MMEKEGSWWGGEDDVSGILTYLYSMIALKAHPVCLSVVLLFYLSWSLGDRGPHVLMLFD